MDWKLKLDQLPTVFHTLTPQDLSDFSNNECLTGEKRGATYFATKSFMPIFGVIYSFSLKGSIRGREYLIKQIIRQLGTPEALDCSNPDFWMYLWKSDSQEIPKTEVHKTLGQNRINQICHQYGLGKEDEILIDTCLAVFRATMGVNPLMRMVGIAYVLKDLRDDKRAKMTKAIFEIVNEFRIKKQQSIN